MLRPNLLVDDVRDRAGEVVRRPKTRANLPRSEFLNPFSRMAWTTRNLAGRRDGEGNSGDMRGNRRAAPLSCAAGAEGCGWLIGSHDSQSALTKSEYILLDPKSTVTSKRVRYTLAGDAKIYQRYLRSPSRVHGQIKSLRVYKVDLDL